VDKVTKQDQTTDFRSAVRAADPSPADVQSHEIVPNGALRRLQNPALESQAPDSPVTSQLPGQRFDRIGQPTGTLPCHLPPGTHLDCGRGFALQQDAHLLTHDQQHKYEAMKRLCAQHSAGGATCGKAGPPVIEKSAPLTLQQRQQQDKRFISNPWISWLCRSRNILRSYFLVMSGQYYPSNRQYLSTPAAPMNPPTSPPKLDGIVSAQAIRPPAQATDSGLDDGSSTAAVSLSDLDSALPALFSLATGTTRSRVNSCSDFHSGSSSPTPPACHAVIRARTRAAHKTVGQSQRAGAPRNPGFGPRRLTRSQARRSTAAQRSTDGRRPLTLQRSHRPRLGSQPRPCEARPRIIPYLRRAAESAVRSLILCGFCQFSRRTKSVWISCVRLSVQIWAYCY